MEIDGKNYNLNKSPKKILLKEITQNPNSKIVKLFSAFDDGDMILSVQELKNAFSTFSGWNIKDKDGKSDNKLTDEEIQQAINSNKKLNGFTVAEVKSFLKSVLNINEKNIAVKQRQTNEQAAKIAQELHDQISGPSLPKNTVEKLKQITPENAAQVLYEYEDITGQSLIDALSEEWGFESGDLIRQYVCQPLKNQAEKKTGKHFSYNLNNNEDINNFVYDMINEIGYEKQPKEKPNEIAKLLFDQISGPSLNKNTLNLMRKITSKNAAQVIYEYQKLAGESLADAVDDEWGLDYETVKRRIVSKLIRQGRSTPNMGWFDYDYSSDIFGKKSTNTFINKLTGRILQTIDNNKYIPKKINPNDYTFEKLKAQYPKCTVRQNGNIIQIRNNSGTFKMQVIKYEDGHYDIKKQLNNKEVTSVYEKSGQIRFGFVDEDTQDKNFFIEPEDIVNQIIENLTEDLTAKKMIFFNTTKERIMSDISGISHSHIIQVMNEFKKQTGQSLIEAIKNAPDIEEKDKNKILNDLNFKITLAFKILSDQITDSHELNWHQKEHYKNGILAEFCINPDFPEAARKSLTNKVYKIISEKINSMSSKEPEKVYSQEELLHEINISQIISREKALPKSMKNEFLKKIEDKISKNIENMTYIDVLNFIIDTIGYDYDDDTQHPTKTDLILHEKGLPVETRIKLLKQLKEKIFKEYIPDREMEQVKDISDAMDKEIESLRNNPDNMSAKLIDKLFVKLHIRHIHIGDEPDKKLKMPNGKIDEISYQGYTGDCWLLASINALAQSPKGLDILNNSIKINKDKSVTITLKGVNKTYTFSLEELLNANELASGDLDVRALEKAVEKYQMEENHDDIVGDYAKTAFDILVGNEKNIWVWQNVKNVSEEFINKINNPNTIVTAAFQSGNKDKTKAASGEELHCSHEYTVKSADEKYVYLINPWDSSSLIKVTHEKFRLIFEDFYEMEL